MKKIFISIAISVITIHAYTQFRMTPADSLRRDSINRVTQKDYNQMLKQLNITSIRPGANGNDPNAPNAPNAANYDEAKANPYPNLPDALTLKNGKKVSDAKTWWQKRKPDDWGTLRAWAWGASCTLDYFESDRNVDAKKVGIEGHSRYGKATVVTMAYDPRFAIAFISSSGEGGVKLHRRNAGELVENVASSGEYHWMAGNFIKYAGPLTWNDMPVDSHELIALCAPRPVFISAGNKGDGWVDARGMFMAAVAAGPVYKLLGKKDLGTTEMSTVETGLVDGEIAFRQHNSGHTPVPNWPTFINFAEKYFK